MKNLFNNEIFINVVSILIVLAVVILIGSIVDPDTISVNAKTIICK